MRSSRELRTNSHSGFTIIELIVISAVVAIVAGAIIGMFVVALRAPSITQGRTLLSAQLATATNRISDDIRKSTGALSHINDTAAPDNTQWQSIDPVSGLNQVLILAQMPRNAAGAPQGIGTTDRDSVVYYLRDGSLYRRFLPLSVATCATPIPGGGCPDDIKIAENVDSSLGIAYLAEDGSPASSPETAWAIEPFVQLKKTHAGQNITATNKLKTAFRQRIPETASTGSMLVGPGGIFMMSNSAIDGSNGSTISTQGKLQFDASAGGEGVRIGSSSQPIKSITVGNASCGTRNTFPIACDPTSDSIRLSTASTYTSAYAPYITANKICARNQAKINTDPSSSYPPQPIAPLFSGLQSGCTEAPSQLPPFNKQAHIARTAATTMAFACASTTCSLGANTTYTGNVALPNDDSTLVLNGDAYIKGNFGNFISGSGSTSTNITIRVAEGVEERPVIVVDGRISWVLTRVMPNLDGVTPIFISFYSTNATCSQNANCSSQIIYDSVQGSYVSSLGFGIGGGANPAIVWGIQGRQGHEFHGSLYAYYGAATIATFSSTTPFHGTIAAQRLFIVSSKIELTDDTWRN